MGFWKAITSIDEEKVSITILVFIVTTVFGLIQAILYGDISSNVLAFLIAQLGAIFGINTISNVRDAYVNRNRYEQYEDNEPRI